jgi:hypothetical protein
MRILELENRCMGNRTVGSNPILSATQWLTSNGLRVEMPVLQTVLQTIDLKWVPASYRLTLEPTLCLGLNEPATP